MKKLILIAVVILLTSCNNEPPKKVTVNVDSAAYKIGKLVKVFKENYNKGLNDTINKK